jgi:hypothetical protein
MLVGSGRTKDLLLATAWITKTHGWLLWDTTATVLTTTDAFVAVVKHAFLLSGGIDTAWGLLADSHAELLIICKLGLHCNQAVSLVPHGFLCDGVRSTDVRKEFTV